MNRTRTTFFNCFLGVLVSTLWTTSGLGEGWRPIHPIRGVTFSSDLRVTYDDNIFRYSPQDIEEFVGNMEPHRYPIESYDDLITTLSLSAKARRHLISHSLTTFNLHYKLHNYAVNPIKSYQILSLNLWQSLLGTSYLQLGYLFLPSYLIRHYPDWDAPHDGGPPVYVGCRFSEHLLSLQAGGVLPAGVSLSAFYKMEMDDYNQEFSEYDTRANRYGVEANYKLRQTLSLGLGYRFKQARAKGYDSEGEHKETSDDPDISYDRDTFLMETGLDLERVWGVPIGFNLDYSFERKCFTSLKSLWEDPFHVGREDKGHHFGIEVDWEPNPRVQYTLGWSWRMRDTYSPYPGEIEEVKDFRQNQFSAGISFSY